MLRVSIIRTLTSWLLVSGVAGIPGTMVVAATPAETLRPLAPTERTATRAGRGLGDALPAPTSGAGIEESAESLAATLEHEETLRVDEAIAWILAPATSHERLTRFNQLLKAAGWGDRPITPTEARGLFRITMRPAPDRPVLTVSQDEPDAAGSMFSEAIAIAQETLDHLLGTYGEAASAIWIAQQHVSAAKSLVYQQWYDQGLKLLIDGWEQVQQACKILERLALRGSLTNYCLDVRALHREALELRGRIETLDAFFRYTGDDEARYQQLERLYAQIEAEAQANGARVTAALAQTLLQRGPVRVRVQRDADNLLVDAGSVKLSFKMKGAPPGRWLTRMMVRWLGGIPFTTTHLTMKLVAFDMDPTAVVAWPVLRGGSG